MAIRYALTVVYGVSVARSMTTLITVDMLMAMALIVKYALITIPSGVRGARKLTRTTTLVMRSQILVSIGVRIAAKIVLTGAIVATIILEMSAGIARVVVQFIHTHTSLTLYSMVRIRINYTSV
jgi:hypothetical protein